MSVYAWINLVFNRRIRKYVEYVAICSFGSTTKIELKQILFFFGFGKTWVDWSVNLKIKKLWPKLLHLMWSCLTYDGTQQKHTFPYYQICWPLWYHLDFIFESIFSDNGTCTFCHWCERLKKAYHHFSPETIHWCAHF